MKPIKCSEYERIKFSDVKEFKILPCRSDYPGKFVIQFTTYGNDDYESEEMFDSYKDADACITRLFQSN